MRTILTLFTAITLGAGVAWADAKTPPYASTLANDADWTTVNVLEGSKTWVANTSASSYSGTGFSEGIQYSYDSSNPGDDWYISPAIHLEANTEYKVKFWVKKNNNEALRLMLAPGATVDDLSGGTALYDDQAAVSPFKKEVIIFTPEAAGDYHFGFHCYSPKNGYWIYLTGFEVAENKFAPAPVENLTVTPGADRALEATLGWTLPSTDSDGAALPDGYTVSGVDIFRDDALVKSLEGEATSWTDNAASGLTPGYHTYEVKVTINGTSSAAARVNSKYIGPVQAFDLPYAEDFKTIDQETFDLFWATETGRDGKSSDPWKVYISSYYGNALQLYVGNSGKEDHWLISPAMKFEQAGVYRLTLSMKYNSSANALVDVILGQGTSIGGYTDDNIILTINKIPNDYTTFETIFAVETPGEYSVALHNHCDTPTWYTYYLNKLTVEKWNVAPAQVTDLTATVNADATVTLNWTNPTLTNTGGELPSISKVEVYCNGELVNTLTEVTPGQAMETTHRPDATGVFTYHVLPYFDENPADGDIKYVTTGWVGDETQTPPYSTTFKATDATTPIWSSFDGNDDGYTFVVNGSAKMNYPNKTDMHTNDDYLLSPYFDLAAGYYTVTFKVKGEKKVNYGVGIVADKTDVAASYKKLGSVKTETYNEKEYSTLIHVEEGGRYAIAIHLNETYYGEYNTDTYYIPEITSFAVAYRPLLPGVATDLAVAPGAEMALTAEVSWTNPSVSNLEGVAVPALVKAVVCRDGEEIGTITEGLAPGERSSFVDQTVPQAGEYTYSVAVFGPEGPSEDAAAEVKSPWIGAGLDLPWNCDSETGFRDMGWTILNVNGDTNTWGDEITWNLSYNNAYIMSVNNTPDDWLITPRFNFLAGGVYTIEIHTYLQPDYDPVAWDLHFGRGVAPEDMVQKLITVTTKGEGKANAEVTSLVIEAVDAMQPEATAEGDETEAEPERIKVPACVGTLGIHANKKGYFYVNKFNVAPDPVTGVADAESSSSLFHYASGKILFSGEANVAVADVSGKVVLRAAGVDSVDLNHLQSGVYIVSATVGEQTVSFKVVK